MDIHSKPLTENTWNDLLLLFGTNGACGGCWCMNMRLKRSEYEKNKGDKNRDILFQWVSAGIPCGLIAYIDCLPIAWCSVTSRSNLKRLETSRIFKPVVTSDVWSVNCLYIDKKYRKMGVSRLLIDAAIIYARENGAGILEAYPHDPGQRKMVDVFSFAGFSSTFLEAGFSEEARYSAYRPIMQKKLT